MASYFDASRWHRRQARPVGALLCACSGSQTPSVSGTDAAIAEPSTEVRASGVPATGAAIGRSPWDAPEIDGKVFLPDERGLTPGDLVTAEVYGADDYDLLARRGGGQPASRARKSPRTALPR